MKFTGVYFVCLIFWKEMLVLSTETNYFDGLIKYLNEESKLYQVVFIIKDSGNNTDPVMNSLMTTVNSHFPSFSISYSDLKYNTLEESHIKLLTRPRSTTLFVLQWNNITTLNEFDKFLTDDNNLLVGSSKPRCLVLNSLSTSQDVINKTLHSFWLKKYLDVTLLTYRNHQLQTKIELISPVLPILSRLNPFFNKYSSQTVSSESKWFPNKLLNMNGYKVNFSGPSADDTSEDEYNKGRKIVDILSHEMKFEPYVVDLLTPDGKINFGKNESEREILYQKLVNKTEEIDPQIWLQYSELYNDCCMEERNVRVFKLNSVKAVIPREAKLTEDFEVSSEFWYMILITVGTIVIIRLTALLLKFKKSTWQTLNISQIIIGMSSPEEPDNLAERIIFGSLLIACIVYSGYFYSVILDISFCPAPEISTLAQLIKSNMTTMMQHAYKFSLPNSSTSEIGQWIEKATPCQSVFDCLKLLANDRNVSCVFGDAENDINAYETMMGEINAKILPETIGSGVNTFVGSSYSPYIDRFNEIILKASGFGLLNEFYSERQHVSSVTSGPELIAEEKLLPILFFVLAIGYSLSTVIFILEVIAVKILSQFLERTHL